MQFRNVVVLTSDRTLLHRTASGLALDGWGVRTDLASGSRAQLVVRDWRDDRRLPDPGVPVLTLDLSIVTGPDLVEVVGRALGLQQRASFAALAAFGFVLKGRLPQA